MPVRKKLKLSGKATAFITTTVRNWMPVFTNKNMAYIALNQLNETSHKFNVGVVCFVLMPSHIHMMLGFHKIESMPKFMQTFKSLTSRQIKQKYTGRLKDQMYENGKYRLWMPRYDDLIIESQKQFDIKMSYIHNNPVKDKLVSSSVDWPYSSAIDWTGGKNGFVDIDMDFEWCK